MKIPSKIKIFLWKSSHNWLSTGYNLNRRRIQVDVSCPVCYRRPETSLHALWCYPAVKHIRMLCPSMKGLKCTDGTNFVDFMIMCINVLNNDFQELLCVIFFCMWFLRNQHIHCPSSSSDREVVFWANSFIQEFRDVNFPEAKSPVSADGNGKVGLGIIIHDGGGEVLACRAVPILADFSPVISEALAILHGLRFALEIGRVPCLVETDSLVIINLLRNDVMPFAEVGLIVQDIRRSRSSVF
ncbi:hypothetical protein Ddye_016925 [Dipteronia dyeriana]|uniref:RNase H type-1 domain-containing protein n=1 Tax=Dipteronia dyeriana TaxID=168575 RepID=A0AAD9U7N0_9ROSI|nr:hypothetical protein Ddye_016925 [Dipteronia dyeriana]